MKLRFFFLISFFSVAGFSLAIADPIADSSGTSKPAAAPAKKKKGVKKVVRREQKENEGTEAKGRFEADTILKSQYELEGQPLEVDPD